MQYFSALCYDCSGQKTRLWFDHLVSQRCFIHLGIYWVFKALNIYLYVRIPRKGVRAVFLNQGSHSILTLHFRISFYHLHTTPLRYWNVSFRLPWCFLSVPVCPVISNWCIWYHFYSCCPTLSLRCVHTSLLCLCTSVDLKWAGVCFPLTSVQHLISYRNCQE